VEKEAGRMIEKIIDKVLTTITDPLMLFALIMIGGLFYLLIQRDKALKEVFQSLKEHTTGLEACNKSICSILPLIEVLVYGKGGKKDV
jgi:hypothetical protein